jgi:hypothetical protein
MTKIKHYRIAEGPIQIITEEVNRLMSEGYQPYGELSTYIEKIAIETDQKPEFHYNYTNYYQVMVKED